MLNVKITSIATVLLDRENQLRIFGSSASARWDGHLRWSYCWVHWANSQVVDSLRRTYRTPVLEKSPW